MSYVVKTAQQHFEQPKAGMDALFEHWTTSVVSLIEKLPDADAVNHRDLVSLPELRSASDLAECREVASGVLKIGRQMLVSKNLGKHAASLKEALEAVEVAGKCLAATGLSEPPSDESDSPAAAQWWSHLGKLSEAVNLVRKIALELTPMTGRLKDCGKIVGQIMGASVDPKDLLLLLDDGEIVAMAAIGAGVGSIPLHDLVVSPQYIRRSGSGAGGALMEYIARDAKKAGVGVYLLSLGEAASEVYLKWGFVKSGEAGMSLHGDALDAFLKKHTVFAPS